MSNEVLNFKVARLHRLSKTGPMRAFADLCINDLVVVRGLRVVEGSKGVFVSMPQEKGKDNKWYDTIRCLSPEVRQQIAQCVLKAYAEEAK